MGRRRGEKEEEKDKEGQIYCDEIRFDFGEHTMQYTDNVL